MMAGRQFFSGPPFAYVNSGPPLWPTDKKLPPPFDHPEKFQSPHKQTAPLPVKNDSSLVGENVELYLIRG